MLYINNQTNTCVTVNRIRAALKETARYIPAATVCFILIIKQQNHSLLSTFVALLRNKGRLIITVKTVLFYIRLFDFSSRLLTEYFRLALIIIILLLLYGPLIIVLNNRDCNIYQNNRYYDFVIIEQP